MKYLYLIIGITAIFMMACEPSPAVVISQPQALIGLWTNTGDGRNGDTLLTSLNLESNGNYVYAERLIAAQTDIYKESGQWEVHHLDEDGNRLFDENEDRMLKLMINQSINSDNNGKEDFVYFFITELAASRLLELELNERTTIILSMDR